MLGEYKTNKYATIISSPNNQYFVVPESSEEILKELQDPELIHKLFNEIYTEKAKLSKISFIIGGIIWAGFLITLLFFYHSTQTIYLLAGAIAWSLFPLLFYFISKDLNNILNRYIEKKVLQETQMTIFAHCRPLFSKASKIPTARREELIELVTPRMRDNLWDLLEEGKFPDQQMVDNTLNRLLEPTKRG